MNRLFGCGSEYLKGTTRIKLAPLGNAIEMSNDVPIELVSKRITPSLNVTIKVRTPFASKEFTTKEKKGFKVVKIYPAFNAKPTDQAKNIKDFNISTIGIPKKANAPLKKKSTMTTMTNGTNRSPNQPQSSTNVVEPKKAEESVAISPEPIKPIEINTITGKVDKSLFTELELNTPDCLENLNTMEVLLLKEKELDEKMKTIEGRTPAALRQQLVKLRCKKNVLGDQLGEEAITPENYLAIIQKQLDHDKLLYAYFKQQNDTAKSALVASRLPLLMKELKETTAFIQEKKA